MQTENGGSEVLHYFYLPFRASDGGGENGSPDSLCAVMDAQPACQQAVAEGDLYDVILDDSARAENARDKIAPGPQVLPCVTDNARICGRARRCMDPDHLAQGHGKHLIRIALGLCPVRS